MIIIADLVGLVLMAFGASLLAAYWIQPKQIRKSVRGVPWLGTFLFLWPPFIWSIAP